MVDGPDLEIDGLERAKGPLDLGELLVGQHGLICSHDLLGHRGANHIDAIHGGVTVQGVVISHESQAVVTDVNPEILPNLEPGKHGASPEADLALAFQWLLLAGAGIRYLLQGRFRELEQGLPLARPFLMHDRVEAGDEPLAEVLGMRDLGDTSFIEQAGRDDLRLHHGPDGAMPQRGNPVVADR